MNKEIYKIEIKKVLTSIDATEEKLMMVFDDSTTIEFSSYHEQDCCESVFADFSPLKYHKEQLEGKHVRELVIKEVSEIGILFSYEMEYTEYAKVFVPCYNYQNGYYSDDLELLIRVGEEKTRIDISSAVEEHID